MQIEEGKHYKRRDGKYAGIAKINTDQNASAHPFKVGKDTYTRNGAFNAMIDEHGYDLVAECDGPPDFSEPAGSILLDWQATAEPAYAPLAAILQEAYDQAASGKGKERHNNGRPYVQQPTMEIGRMVGVGYPVGQAMKKSREATGMLARGEDDAAIRELLGAINYAAAAVILIRERKRA